jgi:hypothetical protein
MDFPLLLFRLPTPNQGGKFEKPKNQNIDFVWRKISEGRKNRQSGKWYFPNVFALVHSPLSLFCGLLYFALPISNQFFFYFSFRPFLSVIHLLGDQQF